MGLMGRLVDFDGVDGVAGKAGMFRIVFREITTCITWSLEN
jgi:hypothetical protein